MISKTEERLYCLTGPNADRLRPICVALKESGYEAHFIAEIMHQLQLKPELPAVFSIINNRYLVCRKGDDPYDLVDCVPLPGHKVSLQGSMALTFWP